ADGSVTMLASRQCTAIFNVPGLQDQTITFDSIGDQPFFSQPFSVAATASSGLPVSFSAFGHCSVNGSAVTATGLGSCTITASQAGDASFNAAPPVSQTFAIQQASQTISFGPIADKTYGDPPFAISASASSGLPVSFAITGDCGLSGTTVTLYRAGTCTITASQNGNVSYGAATPVVRTFAIQKKAQTITFAALSDQPNGTQFWVGGASASSGLTVAFRRRCHFGAQRDHGIPQHRRHLTDPGAPAGQRNPPRAPPGCLPLPHPPGRPADHVRGTAQQNLRRPAGGPERHRHLGPGGELRRERPLHHRGEHGADRRRRKLHRDRVAARQRQLHGRPPPCPP